MQYCFTMLVHVLPPFLSTRYTVYTIIGPHVSALSTSSNTQAAASWRHLFFATTSANSVVGSIYGTTVSRTFVRCSNAYANPINISSLHFGPMKLIPNGKFGAIAVRSPNPFGTIVVLAEYLPNGTVTTGEPMRAGKLGLNSVGRMSASREWFFSAPVTPSGPAR